VAEWENDVPEAARTWRELMVGVLGLVFADGLEAPQ
jgi:hypothetical protein